MRRVALLLAGFALLGGCAAEPTATESAAGLQPRAALSRAEAQVNQDLAALRRATASFHSFEAAGAAGWDTKITSCMTDPTDGGMGFHYGNTELIDGSVRPDQPELLLYEPEKNGQMRLVAAEYIIPYSFHSRDSTPPMLFDQPFKQVDAFQLWGLHAWVWENNPSGMFKDWNPRVNCDNTTDIMAMVP